MHLIGSYNSFMKLLIVIVIFCSTLAFSKSKPLLKCLGTEEAQYHKLKISGAYLNLNQKIISDFVQMSDTLDINSKFLKEVCQHPEFPPSLSLLNIILKHQEKAFIISAHKKDIALLSKDKKTITEVLRRGFYSFLEFIDDLQTQVSKPNCIVNSIPELKIFYLKTRYTLEDTGYKMALKDIKDIEFMVKKLNSKDLIKACSQSQP